MIALYLRLSMADGDLGCDGKDESNSIENQRAILWDFIHQKDDVIGEVKEYIDDGYSGTNFNRPAFKRMLEDMKKGLIGTMLTKDLSRLGRNYIEVGDYMEQIFPMLGVRYIAVNSNYDSSEYIGSTSGLEMSFMNLVNSMYSKDLSKKWHSAVETKWKNGLSTSGRTPFGYTRDPERKGKWIIEPYAYSIVRKIYGMVNEGMDVASIVDQLNEEGVITPGQYREKFGYVRTIRRKVTDDEWLWDKNMLRKILRTYEYTGALVHSKATAASVGSSSRRVVPESERFVIEGHHEPIVSREEYDRGTALFGTIVRGENVNNRDYPLADIIYCGNCRLRMEYCKTRDGAHMKCRHKRQVGSASKCKRTKYSTDMIDAIVRSALRKQLFELELLNVKLSFSMKPEKDTLSIDKIERQISVLQAHKKEAYEAFAGGTISKEEYIRKRDDIKYRISQLETKREVITSPDNKKLDLCRSAEQYLNMAKDMSTGKGLSKTEVEAFIEKIYIYDEKHVEVIFKFDDLLQRMTIETGEAMTA